MKFGYPPNENIKKVQNNPPSSFRIVPKWHTHTQYDADTTIHSLPENTTVCWLSTSKIIFNPPRGTNLDYQLFFSNNRSLLGE